MLNKPPPNATPGEKSFYNRLKIFTEKNPHVIGYVEPYLGGLRPDFLILSPKFGILIAEIKDYFAEFLKTISKSGNWEYLRDDINESITNPYDQINHYWRAVKDRVNFCQFPSNINIPITLLVVFSQISKQDNVAEEIRNVAPKRIQTCYKETIKRYDNFEQYLSEILPLNFKLSDEDFKILRGNIVPTSRLPTRKQADLSQFFTAENMIKLLDQEQERMARKIGDGHRLVFGVAGSGKTVLLIARARNLALKHPEWKILILCYNKLLKKQLFHLLNPLDYEADITISTFHGWARQYILSSNSEFSRLYEEASLKAEREQKLDDFFQTVVPKMLISTMEDLWDKKVLYDAILIDEAQDFEKDWFQAITLALNPDSNCLLITCDGIQGIYARKRFHWSDVGIQARGRVKRFDKSYRTPIEIGMLAQAALPEFIKNLLNKFDEFIPTAEFIGTHGIVEIIISNNQREECEQLAELIARLLKKPQEILILFKHNMEKRGYDHPLFDQFKQQGIEWKALANHNYSDPGVVIGTIHGTKGLECDTIIIPEVDMFTSPRNRQLLYVGMTRSRKRLILSAKKSTKLLETLKEFKQSN
ncbi:MAG: DEAD/DEAH box helicase [Promethearchaeota archaeon]